MVHLEAVNAEFNFTSRAPSCCLLPLIVSLHPGLSSLLCFVSADLALTVGFFSSRLGTIRLGAELNKVAFFDSCQRQVHIVPVGIMLHINVGNHGHNEVFHHTSKIHGSLAMLPTMFVEQNVRLDAREGEEVKKGFFPAISAALEKRTAAGLSDQPLT